MLMIRFLLTPFFIPRRSSVSEACAIMALSHFVHRRDITIIVAVALRSTKNSSTSSKLLPVVNDDVEKAAVATAKATLNIGLVR